MLLHMGLGIDKEGVVVACISSLGLGFKAKPLVGEFGGYIWRISWSHYGYGNHKGMEDIVAKWRASMQIVEGRKGAESI